MRILNQSDWSNLLALAPPVVENAQIRAALQAYLHDASVEEKFYIYDTIFSSLSVTVPATNTINVDASAPFVCLGGVMHSDIAGAAVTVSSANFPNVKCLIVDQGSNQQWMNQAVHICSLFGLIYGPIIWPRPRLVPASSGIQITLTSEEAGNTPNIHLDLIGYRLFSRA